jgi:hypothetical protein
LSFEKICTNIEALKVEIANITNSKSDDYIDALKKQIDDLEKDLLSKEEYVKNVRKSKTLIKKSVDNIENFFICSFPYLTVQNRYSPEQINIILAINTVVLKLKSEFRHEFEGMETADQSSLDRLDRIIEKYIPIIVNTNKIAKVVKYIGGFIQGNAYFQLQAKLLCTTFPKQDQLNELFASDETMRTRLEILFSDLHHEYDEFNRRQEEFVAYITAKLSYIVADLQTKDINLIKSSYFDNLFTQMLNSDEYIAMKESYHKLIATQNELTQTRNNFAVKFQDAFNRNLNIKTHARQQSLIALIIFTSLITILSSTFFTTIYKVAEFKFIMQFIINNFLMTPIIFALILPIAIAFITFMYNVYSIYKARNQTIPSEYYAEYALIDEKSLKKAVDTLGEFISALENIFEKETKFSLTKHYLEDGVKKETKISVALENISVETCNTIKHIRDFIQHETNFQLQAKSLWESYSEQGETLFCIIQETSDVMQKLNENETKQIKKYQGLCTALHDRYNTFNHYQEELIFYILDALQTQEAPDALQTQITSLVSLSDFDTFSRNILELDKHDEYVAMKESYRKFITMLEELAQARRDALVELQNVMPQLNRELNIKIHVKRQSLLAFIMSISLAAISSCTFFTTISQVAKFKFIMQFIISKFLIAPITFTLILPITITSILFVYKMYSANKTRNQILSLQSCIVGELSQANQNNSDRVEQPPINQSELAV